MTQIQTSIEGPKWVQIKMNEFQVLPTGTVTLVRSTSVPFLGDHFFLVTGPLVKKPHGLRPQGVSIKATATETAILDQHQLINGVIALRLVNKHDIENFLNKHTLASIVL